MVRFFFFRGGGGYLHFLIYYFDSVCNLVNDSDERAKSEKNAHITKSFFHILFGGVDFTDFTFFFYFVYWWAKKYPPPHERNKRERVNARRYEWKPCIFSIVFIFLHGLGRIFFHHVYSWPKKYPPPHERYNRERAKEREDER